MTTDIDLKKLKEDAVHIFTNGFACSESVLYAVRKHFDLDFSDDVIAMSSGFPWGLGGGGCICGALAGGCMCIGYFFGRRTPGDPCINHCFELTKELHDWFRQEFGASCCRVLTKGMQRDSKERKAHCIQMVEKTVVKTAEIILREIRE